MLMPFVAALTLIIASCSNALEGAGEVVKEDRITENFDVVDIRCAANVEIRQINQGEQSKVIVTAQENLIPHILTRVENERLVIDIEERIHTSSDLGVLVLSSSIEKIVHDGSGEVSSRYSIDFA